MRLRGAGPRQIAALAQSNAKDRTDLIVSKTRLRSKDSTARIGAPMLAGNACRLSDPTDADDRNESAHRGAAPEASMGSSRPDRTTSWLGAHVPAVAGFAGARSTSRMRTVNAQAACSLAGQRASARVRCAHPAHAACHPSTHDQATKVALMRSLPLRGRIRRPAATFEQPHSRVHCRNTYLRGSTARSARQCVQPCRLSGRNGVACFDCAGIARDDREADVAVACAPGWRRCLHAG